MSGALGIQYPGSREGGFLMTVLQKRESETESCLITVLSVRRGSPGGNSGKAAGVITVLSVVDRILQAVCTGSETFEWAFGSHKRLGIGVSDSRPQADNSVITPAVDSELGAGRTLRLAVISFDREQGKLSGSRGCRGSG